VTVRFTPTTPATVSANLIITAGGDTVSRTVTGFGTSPSGTLPPGTLPLSVTITSPPGPAYSTTASEITLTGTASSNVTQVTWSNSRGGSGTAAGTTSWSASVALQAGQNVLTARAQDAAGNFAAAMLTAVLTAPLAFTDDPLVPASTVVRAAHFTELRAAIDGLRITFGLTPFAWTDATLTPGSTRVRAVHYTELRNALNEAYQAASRALPTYEGPIVTGGGTVVQASQLSELRAAVKAMM
jgi:hypothetical protein